VLFTKAIDWECYNPSSGSCAEQLIIKMTCFHSFNIVDWH